MPPIDEQEFYNRLLRHHDYISSYGAGLANRVLELFDNDQLKVFVLSKRKLKQRIESMIRREKREASRFIQTELRQAARIELDFMKQLSLDFRDLRLTNRQINDLIDQVLQKQLVDNNLTIEELYDQTFERKRTIVTSLNDQGNLGIKELSAIEAELTAALVQFANGMSATNRTFAFATANELREQAYAQVDVIDRVVISATLDGRTTKYCMNADGKIYKKGEGPRPPFHVRCRTVAIPILDDQEESDVKELLSFRPQVKPGPDYEKGDDTELRSTRNQIQSGQSRVKSSSTQQKSSTSYAQFLAAQTITDEGRQFIRDRIGLRKGERFIRLVQQGQNPDRFFEELLYETEARTLTLEGLKKRS